MSNISVTTVHEHQAEAARILSLRLDAEGFKHVFIGGFACAVLGSSRPTQIETEGRSITILRERLMDLDERFALSGIKFYFVRELHASAQPLERERADDVVENRQGNVLIETLTAGKLGLPAIAGPVYVDDHHKLKLLHPTVLPLTKLKRWTASRSSTRPKTRYKVRTDEQDIKLLIHILVDSNWKLGLRDYEGKTREELLRFVATFHDSFKEDEEFCAALKLAMHTEDWEEMQGIPPMEEESYMPPTD